MISLQISRLRMQNKISQAQLALVLNISPSAMGMYEQGRRVPSLDLLIKLSEYFQVSLDYLITGSEYHHSAQNTDLKNPKNCPCSTCYWKECNK